MRPPGARRLVLGGSLLYLVALVGLPLAALVAQGATLDAAGWSRALWSARTIAAVRLSFAVAFAAAGVSALAGLLIAWVLVRYRFTGRALTNALIDVPFALPTAVAGIALTSLYTVHGWVGAPLARAGIAIAFTPVGIVVALTFLGIPLVVRTLQPVIEHLSRDVEEAAATLGATPIQVFTRIDLPALRGAWITGFSLALARALGEYGSVIFIAGNIPMRTEVAPLLIMTRLEQFETASASAVALLLVAISLLLLIVINRLRQPGVAA